eukprot:131507-Rhodomonas_salina.1
MLSKGFVPGQQRVRGGVGRGEGVLLPPTVSSYQYYRVLYPPTSTTAYMPTPPIRRVLYQGGEVDGGGVGGGEGVHGHVRLVHQRPHPDHVPLSTPPHVPPSGLGSRPPISTRITTPSEYSGHAPISVLG